MNHIQELKFQNSALYVPWLILLVKDKIWKGNSYKWALISLSSQACLPFSMAFHWFEQDYVLQ